MKMTTQKVATAGLALALAAGLTGTAGAQDTIKLAHDNTSHAAIPYIADKKGFYEAEGITVERRVTAPAGPHRRAGSVEPWTSSARAGRASARSRPADWMSWGLR